jgi:polyphosphate kinase 2 (PPK2 family)
VTRNSRKEKESMFKAVDNFCLVPWDGSFRVSGSPTSPQEVPGKKEYKKKLAKLVDELDELQRRLYASDRHAVLLVFQAMDAAGKDSTIRAVLSGVDPAGCQVFITRRSSSCGCIPSS